jgi:hypothetical protein
VDDDRILSFDHFDVADGNVGHVDMYTVLALPGGTCACATCNRFVLSQGQTELMCALSETYVAEIGGDLPVHDITSIAKCEVVATSLGRPACLECLQDGICRALRGIDVTSCSGQQISN